MSNRYTVDQANFTVEVFNDTQEQPYLRQPNWPNGTAWASAAEAEEWAQLFIASIEDEAAPFAPTAPGEPGQPKPTPEQIAEWEAQRLAARSATQPE